MCPWSWSLPPEQPFSCRPLDFLIAPLTEAPWGDPVHTPVVSALPVSGHSLAQGPLV